MAPVTNLLKAPKSKAGAPPPVEAPAPMPVPDDISIKIENKRKAAKRIAQSSRQSTLLSNGDPLG